VKEKQFKYSEAEMDLLEKNIELVGTSEKFQAMAKQNGFKSLGELVKHPVSELMKMPGMNYRILAELGQILKQYELMDIINED
jgi:DNA-directed RNA polymerase alpha subunit